MHKLKEIDLKSVRRSFDSINYLLLWSFVFCFVLIAAIDSALKLDFLTGNFIIVAVCFLLLEAINCFNYFLAFTSIAQTEYTDYSDDAFLNTVCIIKNKYAVIKVDNCPLEEVSVPIAFLDYIDSFTRFDAVFCKKGKKVWLKSINLKEG